jgi:uncharacterized protein (TIGR00255 family)
MREEMNTMVNSMTGFASQTGQFDDVQWTWEIRSVNGRGLDIRLRLPDGSDILEKKIKAAISETNFRGNIGVSLKISQSEVQKETDLDAPEFQSALNILQGVQSRAQAAGLSVQGVSVAEIMSLTKEIRALEPKEDTGNVWEKPLTNEFQEVLKSFNMSKALEGQKLSQVINVQVDEIERLTKAAAQNVDTHAKTSTERLRVRIEALLNGSDDIDPARLEQEVAILAVKADVTEEIDRLLAHVRAARDLMAKKGAVGRNFDFLMQEFNREANTLCSKSGSTELTRIGLNLKTVIDQIREQVQNVE